MGKHVVTKEPTAFGDDPPSGTPYGLLRAFTHPYTQRMGTKTMKVSTATHERISTVAREDGRSMASVVDEAIRDFERKRFFDRLNAAVARTRADPVAWADYQAEVAIFDGAIKDGLDWDDIPEYDLPEEGE
jgi:hypothetical protein